MPGPELGNPLQFRKKDKYLPVGEGDTDDQYSENQQVENPVGHEGRDQRFVDQGADDDDHAEEQRHPEKGVLRVAHSGGQLF